MKPGRELESYWVRKVTAAERVKELGAVTIIDNGPIRIIDGRLTLRMLPDSHSVSHRQKRNGTALARHSASEGS
jgi:hypothetical protein